MKLTPPNVQKKNLQQSNKIEKDSKKDFVDGAGKHIPLEDKNLEEKVSFRDPDYPWNQPGVRKDVTRLFNLRLSEPDWLKLKFISDKTDESMHTICLDVVIPAIARKLRKTLEKELDTQKSEN